MSADDTGWRNTSEAYQQRLMRAADRVDRLMLLHDSPMFSFWHDIKRELADAAEEIRLLRRRVEELQNDTA